ncbi:MAG: energy transducer TonB, partial [Lysobacter sp.]|nr:energy transducer TonB [Lysobacter sp.]
MSAAVAPGSGTGARGGIDEGHRLGATMVLSLLVHGVLLLGVGFALESAAPVVPTLDVILTRTTTALTPRQADFLAQANNQGGGEHDKSSRPTAPQAGPIPQPQDGLAPRPLRAQTPAPSPPPESRVITSTTATDTLPTPRALPEVDPSLQPRGPEK